jgi:hypothetical protein
MGSLPPAAGTATSDPYQLLAAEINAQIEPVYHTTVTLVQYPSQGDFPWYYQNLNDVFNAATFGYISARVSPGDDGTGLAKLSGPGSYPNAYAQLLSQTGYYVSPAGDSPPGYDGAQVLSDLLQATTQPTTANGGMLTIDPVTGVVSSSCQVGYAVNSPLASISDTLQAAKPVLKVQVPAAPGYTATISYPGYQLVAVQPGAWQQDIGTGWYDTDPLAQAYRNGQQGITGYRFTGAPAYNLGPLASGGNFGRLAALLISNQPKVKLNAVSAAASNSAIPVVMSEFLQSLRLLNLGQPAGQQPLMMAAGNGATVPLLQQTAYVIGASLDFISQD